MSNDGSDIPISLDKALNVVLGGGEITEGDTISESDLENNVRTAKIENPDSYGDAGLACARIILEYLEDHPYDRDAPIDDIYDTKRYYDEKGDSLRDYLVTEGLYEKIARKDSRRYEQLNQIGPTGFMWGWAFNIAHKILGMPSQPNPAILNFTLPGI